MGIISPNTKKKIIIFVVLIIVSVLGITLYFGDYYYSNASIIENSSSVKIEEKDNYYFIDGKGTENALIFYQGGKVDELAYLELLESIAENGIDCFLIKMPFNFALFGINQANKVIEEYDYNFYIGGHSMGGVCSCIYANKNASKLKGIVLLASFSNKDLSNYDLRVISILGSNDTVLKKEKYQNALVNMPKDFTEITIDGGNHSYFGNYGMQRGDTQAQISNQTQIELTSKAIINFINN